ncbi:DUF1428 domain-containing protein [Neisseria shayeganii]|uniref:Protein of hypothetical function DUF1428 n=1 Tax=Neisseria shayeganii 871 TaxID=1032488 RepID=G4CL80_9NEIS|nr:DUF1428 domain-containing protein [Neisseria shayeganii]EGY51415.1 protein of hypothetical function DUF1428 [Neisseria shayeganii 871]
MNPEHYIDLCLAAVPTANRDTYRQHAAEVAAVVKEHGVLQVVECWGDDVPEGKLTSLPLAVQCRPDETVMCSWFIWPDKATREAGWRAINADPRTPRNMPFDGQRAIFGGFMPLSLD